MQSRQVRESDNSRHSLRAWLGLALCGLLFSLLSACTNNNYAPIYNLERPKTVTKGIHIVRRGDTLYSVAWRYGRDYRELAKANGIRWPYTIYLGQRINLSKMAAAKKWTPTVTGQQASQSKVSVQQKTVSLPIMKTGRIIWQWPVKGDIVGRFNGVSNKGIDIKGKAGQTVKAAADGVVVYAGSGLIGYGNLVIIKHSEVFLSAYAHNKKVLVTEKNKVKAGQKIAEIGSSGTSENKLHFEIRKNGKPVNPLGYLPK